MGQAPSNARLGSRSIKVKNVKNRLNKETEDMLLEHFNSIKEGGVSLILNATPANSMPPFFDFLLSGIAHGKATK